MNNTTYKIIFLFVLSLLPFFALPQNATRQQIDNIKHDKRFLTSTETRSATESEAISEALNKFNYVVNKYIRDSINLLHPQNNIGLEEKEERLVLLEDGVYCVLIYIHKNVILELNGSQSSMQEENTEHQIVQSQDTIQSPTIIETQTTRKNPTTSEKFGNTQECAIELSEWQRIAINELLSCENINAVIAKLQQLKDYFKVKRWGVGKSCPDTSKAYWIVFADNQDLVTILGPGASNRWNFLSANFSSLENYKNMNAIWFYLAK